LGYKRDIKHFKQACNQVGMERPERYLARKAFHAAKARGEISPHMSYGDLMAWLRAWRVD
jgi:hypothetical protein